MKGISSGTVLLATGLIVTASCKQLPSGRTHRETASAAVNYFVAPNGI